LDTPQLTSTFPQHVPPQLATPYGRHLCISLRFQSRSDLDIHSYRVVGDKSY